jgi:hypothetical protein
MDRKFSGKRLCAQEVVSAEIAKSPYEARFSCMSFRAMLS